MPTSLLSLPFPDGRFDLVLARTSCSPMPTGSTWSFNAALHELHRVAP
jgi:ubiquinone/menaquinone biosynthesis C-methylase UbiE